MFGGLACAGMIGRLARARTFLLGMIVVATLAVGAPSVRADVTGGAPRCIDAGVGPSTSADVLSATFSRPIGSWQAGDIAQPYPLPDGRVLWVLNDSYVRPGGAGPIDRSSAFLHNAAIVQTGNCFEAVTDRHPGSTLAPPLDPPAPESFLSGFESADQHWWWFHGGEVSGDTLQVVVTWMSQVLPRSVGIGFRPSDTYIATYDWRTLTLLSLQPAPNRAVRPVYGFAVAHDDTWTYLYGHDDDLIFAEASKDMYLARVPRGHLEVAPTYWSGTGWSSSAAAAVPISTAGTWDHRMRVVHLDDRWIGVEKEDDFFGDEILVSEAPVPEGPWVVTQRFPVANKTSEGSTNTYDAMAMPWLQDGKLVISWSNNAWDYAQIAPNPSLYRPSFATFDLGPPTQSNAICHAVAAGATGLRNDGPTTFFHAVAPRRLLDTRDRGGRVAAGSTTDVDIAGALGVTPDHVAAVLVNMTLTDVQAPGYVTVFPSGSGRPGASTLDADAAGETVANLATARVGSGGAISLYSSAAGHLVVDLAGWYEPATAATAGRFVPAKPVRVLDTRASGSGRVGAGSGLVLPLTGRTVGAPAGAGAVVLTVTAIAPRRAGYVTVWGDGGQPLVSNVNVAPGEIRANQAVVPLGADGAIRLYSSTDVDLAVDVAGWFTGVGAPSTASGLFVPIDPIRLFDSRAAAGVPHGGCTATALAPREAGAAVLNVTLTDADGPGYATAWPADTARPVASSVNVDRRGETRAAHAAVATAADGTVSVFLYERGQAVVDETGWFTR